MAENSGKVRPIATAAAAAELRRNRCVICCGGIAGILLVQSAIAAILAFTVFKLRSPIIRVEKLSLNELEHELINGGNVTLHAVVLVKNPNFASFRYRNMTTTLFYGGAVIGQLHGPPGRAEAHRTTRVNITADIMTDRVLSRPSLATDIGSGLVNVSSVTRVGGKMNFFIFEKEMTMKMKCNVSVNITSKSIQQHKCKRRIKL